MNFALSANSHGPCNRVGWPCVNDSVVARNGGGRVGNAGVCVCVCFEVHEGGGGGWRECG